MSSVVVNIDVDKNAITEMSCSNVFITLGGHVSVPVRSFVCWQNYVQNFQAIYAKPCRIVGPFSSGVNLTYNGYKLSYIRLG